MQLLHVLDHGYVGMVEKWGSDERIIEAARMSTSKGFQGWGPVHNPNCLTLNFHSVMMDDGSLQFIYEGGRHDYPPDCNCNPKAGDEKLLKYLWEHKHMSPFEMAGMVIEVQAPIFVFREWHRHRTQSYNELSARYTPLPDLFYLPSIERLMGARQGTKNKQGSEDGWDQPAAEAFHLILERSYEKARSDYDYLLGMGVSREISRLVIPVAQYSRMRASANLRNWLQFLTLRTDPAAQWEIRQFALAVSSLIEVEFPRTWLLFAERLDQEARAAVGLQSPVAS